MRGQHKKFSLSLPIFVLQDQHRINPTGLERREGNWHDRSLEGIETRSGPNGRIAQSPHRLEVGALPCLGGRCNLWAISVVITPTMSTPRPRVIPNSLPSLGAWLGSGIG